MTLTLLHRRILSQSDLDAFLASDAFGKLSGFLSELVNAVKGVPLSGIEKAFVPSQVAAFMRFLVRARTELIAQHPTDRSTGDSNRFGSAAFRDWLNGLQAELLPELMEALHVRQDKDQDQESSLADELEGYLMNAFGSAQRIDYGTGHELHFLVALLCFRDLLLEREDGEGSDEKGATLSMQTTTDSEAIQIRDLNRLLVLQVFWEYLRLMRTLQATYWLEPAGSHGVWGLDDYHFLPFLFGAGQLCGHGHLRPRAIHSPDIVEYLAPEYMYFECIANILRLKESLQVHESSQDADPVGKEPRASAIRWLSPLLDDISAAKSWDKVCSGLERMWRAEVAGKLPIMQHFLFGKTLAFDSPQPKGNTEDASAATATEEPAAVHYRHNLRGDCCGNPLPSIYSALNTDSDSAAKDRAGSGDSNASDKAFLRQPGLPFD